MGGATRADGRGLRFTAGAFVGAAVPPWAGGAERVLTVEDRVAPPGRHREGPGPQTARRGGVPNDGPSEHTARAGAGYDSAALRPSRSRGIQPREGAVSNSPADAGVHVSQHPAVKHKLALLRSERTEPKKFRELVRELSWLLGYRRLRTHG